MALFEITFSVKLLLLSQLYQEIPPVDAAIASSMYLVKPCYLNFISYLLNNIANAFFMEIDLEHILLIIPYYF